jgi:hypothetical protein
MSDASEIKCSWDGDETPEHPYYRFKNSVTYWSKSEKDHEPCFCGENGKNGEKSNLKRKRQGSSKRSNKSRFCKQHEHIKDVPIKVYAPEAIEAFNRDAFDKNKHVWIKSLEMRIQRIEKRIEELPIEFFDNEALQTMERKTQMDRLRLNLRDLKAVEEMTFEKFKQGGGILSDEERHTWNICHIGECCLSDEELDQLHAAHRCLCADTHPLCELHASPEFNPSHDWGWLVNKDSK